jgi:hypothetical protein
MLFNNLEALFPSRVTTRPSKQKNITLSPACLLKVIAEAREMESLPLKAGFSAKMPAIRTILSETSNRRPNLGQDR